MEMMTSKDNKKNLEAVYDKYVLFDDQFSLFRPGKSFDNPTSLSLNQ